MVIFESRSRYATLIPKPDLTLAVFLGVARDIPFPVKDGFEALALLADLWKCDIESIKYELPETINSTDDEMKIIIFHRGCGFVDSERHVNDPGGVYWADFAYTGKMFIPRWRKAVLGIEWHTLTDVEAYTSFEQELGKKYKDAWIEQFENSHPFHSRVDLPTVDAPFYRMEGKPNKWRGYEMKRFTKYVHSVRVPLSPFRAETISEFVQQEVSAVMRNYCESLFEGVNNTDVIYVDGLADYVCSINASAIQRYPWSWDDCRYDVPWKGQSSFVLVRVRPEAKGHIRCADAYKGRVIGRQGVKIDEIARKHGYGRLLLVDPD